jgi:hypothetical protein
MKTLTLDRDEFYKHQYYKNIWAFSNSWNSTIRMYGGVDFWLFGFSISNNLIWIGKIIPRPKWHRRFSFFSCLPAQKFYRKIPV